MLIILLFGFVKVCKKNSAKLILCSIFFIIVIIILFIIKIKSIKQIIDCRWCIFLKKLYYKILLLIKWILFGIFLLYFYYLNLKFLSSVLCSSNSTEIWSNRIILIFRNNQVYFYCLYVSPSIWLYFVSMLINLVSMFLWIL